MSVKFRRLTPEDYVVSEWSGGKTTQLAIYPEGSVYAERKFTWRLSSATVQLESSDFTPLPDYERLISVLRGQLRLRHGDGHEIVLSPYEIHPFDGAVPTSSKGRCTDFNLMLRKGKCCGSLQAIVRARQGEIFLTAPIELSKNFPSRIAALFCISGRVTAEADGQSAELNEGETLLIEGLQNFPLRLWWQDGTEMMLAQIQF